MAEYMRPSDFETLKELVRENRRLKAELAKRTPKTKRQVKRSKESSRLMKRAHAIRKTQGLTMSEAMKRAYAE